MEISDKAKKSMESLGLTNYEIQDTLHCCLPVQIQHQKLVKNKFRSPTQKFMMF